MNNVSLVGRITKDLELKYTPSGMAYCKFTLAVNRQFKKEGQPEADFLPVTVFNKQAENLANYMTKGSQIGVNGQIQTGSYEKDGQRVFTTDIIAQSVQFLESKKEAQPQAQTERTASQMLNVPKQGEFNRQQPNYQQMNTGQLAPTFGQPQQGYDPNNPPF